MTHVIHERLLRSAVKVLLVGGGGTGSRILEQLVCVHRALLAKGHPQGLQVTLVDPDVVSPANVGRQAFYPSDVGAYKAHILIHRANMALNGEAFWKSDTRKLERDCVLGDYDLVIGAVDNRAARLAMLSGLQNASHGIRYWLDIGNRSSDGQVVLGEVKSKSTGKGKVDTKLLPHIAEFYPEMVDPSKEQDDDTPSCSLAEALEKQSLFINPAVSVQAMTILWNLFTKGEIEVHGAFINLDQSTVLPLRVDPEVWKRFGVRKARRSNKIKARSS